jgi:hypothetical protein
MDAAGLLEEAIAAHTAADGDPDSSGHGVEILYLLLGHTYFNRTFLSAPGASADDTAAASALLAAAEAIFRQGLARNPAYPRLHYSLAGVLRTQAYLGVAADAECAFVDWDRMHAAEASYQEAQRLSAGGDFQQSDIELHANVGLGRIYYARGLCQSSADELERARTFYRAAVAIYEAGPAAHLEAPVSFAYTELADSYLYASSVFERDLLPAADTAAALSVAADDYAAAIDLNLKLGAPRRLALAAEILPRRLIALCHAGRQGEVIPYLDQVTQQLDDPIAIRQEILTNLSSFLPKECTDE